MKYYVSVAGTTHEVEVVERLGALRVSVDGAPMELTYEEADRLGQVVVLHEGRSFAMSIEGDDAQVGVTLAGHHYACAIEDERERAAHLAEREAAGGGGVVTAVMPGIVLELLVQPGGTVQKGQPLLILEAMKMQNEIAAPADGVVESVHVEAGRAVAAGAKLMTLRGTD